MLMLISISYGSIVLRISKHRRLIIRVFDHYS